MVGDNDTRCPLQQVLNYADRLAELGKPFELDRFDAGHGALVVNERIRQMEIKTLRRLQAFRMARALQDSLKD